MSRSRASGEREAALRDAGVDDFIFAGGDALVALSGRSVGSASKAGSGIGSMSSIPNFASIALLSPWRGRAAPGHSASPRNRRQVVLWRRRLARPRLLRPGRAAPTCAAHPAMYVNEPWTVRQQRLLHRRAVERVRPRQSAGGGQGHLGRLRSRDPSAGMTPTIRASPATSARPAWRSIPSKI